MGSNILLLMVVQQEVAILEFSQEKMSTHPFTPPCNITVIQVYALTSNAKEAETEWLYEDLQDFLELTPKKRCPFHIGDWNAKVGSQEIP